MIQARGLSLYMSILSIIAIEVFTYLEFAENIFFFIAWSLIFGILALFEFKREMLRSTDLSKKQEEEPLPVPEKRFERFKKTYHSLTDTVLILCFGFLSLANMVLLALVLIFSIEI
ncbi:MAG: hypothetical protein Q7I98_03520 [Erysipelotrichaceae bacterium]|nr:hypothetical protein [Erysipelotrichaceae bacterium]